MARHQGMALFTHRNAAGNSADDETVRIGSVGDLFAQALSPSGAPDPNRPGQGR